MTELEKIDLELFKACFPQHTNDNPQVYVDEIRCGNGLSINRFTQDERLIFRNLIPELNRRGWYYTVSYDPSFQCHEAMFWNEDAQDFKATDDNNVAEAVSKAAYAALKGEK